MKVFQQCLLKMGLYYTLITSMGFDYHHFCLSLNFLKFICFVSFFFLLLIFISFLFFISFVFICVWTIAPRKIAPPPVRVRVWVSVQGWWGTFPQGQLSQNRFYRWKTRRFFTSQGNVTFIYYMCKATPYILNELNGVSQMTSIYLKPKVLQTGSPN